MKKEDYFAARRLLDSISHGIHHFDTYKASVFNIRELSKLAAMMRKQGIEIDEIPKPKDKEVIEVFKKFEFAKAYAFLTYTPFIKSEILARVFLMVLATCLSFLGKLGWKSLMMAAENLKWAEAQIEHVHQMNNHATV